jgi:hypothetical protein
VSNISIPKIFPLQKFFLYQSKYYVKITSDFEPASWRKISARKRAKNSEFVWENRRESLGRASRVPHFGFQKTDKFPNGVSIVPS